MNPGITRWKIVPSYSGTPCLLAPLTGFFQSLVPLARPIKFSTPTGALSGKSVHVIFPTVGLMMAVGLVAVCTGALAVPPCFGAEVLCLVEVDCAKAPQAAIIRIAKTVNVLCMNAPCSSNQFFQPVLAASS